MKNNQIEHFLFVTVDPKLISLEFENPFGSIIPLDNFNSFSKPPDTPGRCNTIFKWTLMNFEPKQIHLTANMSSVTCGTLPIEHVDVGFI